MNDYLQLVLNAFPELDRFQLPRILVDDEFCVKEDILGRYKDGTIRVTENCDPLTLLHEIGHWVYVELFEREIERFGKDMPRSGDSIHEFQWKDLSKKGSKTAEALLDVFSRAKNTPAYRAVEASMPADFDEQFPRLVLLGLSETWANAFAETMVVMHREQKPEARAELASQLGDDTQVSLWETNGYWPVSEFTNAGIAEAVSACIRS